MFDFLGTIVKKQWEESLKPFLQEAHWDLDNRIAHLKLEAERAKRLDNFALKLQQADDVLGGTSLVGNEKATLFPAAYKIPKEVSGGKLTEVLKYLLEQRPKASEVSPPGTITGGDMVWLDIPLEVKEVIFRGGLNDALTGTVVENLKHWCLGTIGRRRETLEYRLKGVLDYREQLLTRIKELEKIKLDFFILAQEIDKQFTDILDPFPEEGHKFDPKSFKGVATEKNEAPRKRTFRNLFTGENLQPLRGYPKYPLNKKQRPEAPPPTGSVS